MTLRALHVDTPNAGFLQGPRDARQGQGAAQPDLILLDVHLPDISGNQAIALLRRDPATAAIPVVILSADATVRQRKRLVAAGAHAYLTKPLDVAEFLGLIDEHASHREAHAR